MVFVTGDTHLSYFKQDAGKLFKRRKGFPIPALRRTDYLIVLGDFSLFWSKKSICNKENIRKIQNLPYTLLFLDGNHENFDWLEEFPVAERFGGKVQICGENIVHLMRGEIYQIQEKTFFVCGGAMSHDIEFRQPHITWWPQEQVSAEEERNACKNLDQAGTIDFILTHTCPDTIVQEMFGKVPSRNATERFLSKVAARLPDVPWYFGHHHEDTALGRYHAIYNRILRIV